ncbi:MAG TPA: hypothetical protein VFV87_19385 [Pirellulaceae bacterium]|nr:hypothetical protein [Pirellulaceae bacterium]
MPALFERFGVKILYPENWSLMDLEVEDWPRSVTIQSQDTGFWSLHVYPPQQEAEPILEELVSAIGEGFSDVEVLPATEQFGETSTAGVDLAFFYLDLLVEAKIRYVHTPSAMLVWHYQAESREFERIEPVFQAIATSLLRTQVAIKE